jgi:hypothetical protein
LRSSTPASASKFKKMAEKHDFSSSVKIFFNYCTNFQYFKLFWIRAILRQNTEFSAKNSPSIKSEKILANLVDFYVYRMYLNEKIARKIRWSWSGESSKWHVFFGPKSVIFLNFHLIEHIIKTWNFAQLGLCVCF